MSAVAAAVRRKYPTITPNEAARLIQHCSMGARQVEIDSVLSTGYRAWVEDQLSRSALNIIDFQTDYPGLSTAGDGFNEVDYDCERVVAGITYTTSSQLRMRAVDALSQYFVVNESPFRYHSRPDLVRAWAQLLCDNAFGNFRTLLEDVSKSCHMGWYLTFKGNAKATATTQPDENYARELLQLFTIGLWELNNDGTRKKTGDLPVNDSRYVLNGVDDVHTYTLQDVRGLARVFTGWSSQTSLRTSSITDWSQSLGNNRINERPMIQYPAYHELGTKEFLGVTVPANTPWEASLTIAMDTLFNHSSLPPFFCTQMIQRCTTSNPSPEYVSRVVAAFINNGQGVRGDLRAVWRAILLDQEALSTYTAETPSWGRVREPYAAFMGRYRGIEAVTDSSDGFTYVDNPNSYTAFKMGQVPFDSPSVFNFYLPEFKPAGELASLGMKSPELQVLGEATLTNLCNFQPGWNSLILGFASNFRGPVGGEPLRACYVDMSLWESDARTNIPAMVDRIILLVNGRLVADSVRTQMIASATAITNANSWHDRLNVAFITLVTSPSYLVQR